MRSFPVIYLLIFLIFYFLITIGAYKNLIRLFSNSKKKTVNWIFWSTNLFIICSFIFLYIYPHNAREASNYPAYFYFNSLLFADIIFKVPLSFSLLLYYLFFRVQHRRSLLYSGVVISVGLVLTILYGVFIGNQNLKIREYELEFKNLPKEFNNYKIAQISDLHLGSWLDSNKLLEHTADKIEGIKPDLFLFTGDMVNNYANETVGWIEYFSKMTKGIPSYAILGNHDYGDYTNWESEEQKRQNFQGLLQSMKNMGFKILNNESVILRKGNDSIFLAGVENWGHAPFPQYADLESAMQTVTDSAFTILMTHDPAHWESKVKYMNKINLTLSGHTHGLQWGVKPAGISLSLSYLTRKNWSGLYKFEKSALIVNAGLGTIGIPWRIDMPPEITVITLKRLEIN